jgi:hypothetical protein
MNDAQLLAGLPEFLSIGSMLKATPQTEGGRRIVYFEASNEGLDQQGEVIAAKALADSADYFKRYGNIDIDHYTLLGKPNPQTGREGIPGCGLYEIGRPEDVRQKNGSTFVKAVIYSGVGPAAEQANDFWSSITDLSPPARWYPSVGGSIDKTGTRIIEDPKTGLRKAIITKVRWTNIGVSKTPVNQHVGICATMPLGAFAKSWTSAGWDFSKAIEAGYGTDSATLEGGGALREQSLDKQVHNYFDFRDRLSGAVVKHQERGQEIEPSQLAEYSRKKFSMTSDHAADWVERFLRDLKNGLKPGAKR